MDRVCTLIQKTLVSRKILPPVHRPLLTTTFITNVAKTYSQKYTELHGKHSFKYLGTFPCNKLTTAGSGGYERVALVVNTDTSDGPGIHWVAVFVDNKTKTLEIFDSTGTRVNDCIFRLLLRSWPRTEYVYTENKTVHQLGKTECGVYSLYYIVSRLCGLPSKELYTTVIRDDEISKLRRIFQHFSGGANVAPRRVLDTPENEWRIQ
jgi:hypothetical protein